MKYYPYKKMGGCLVIDSHPSFCIYPAGQYVNSHQLLSAVYPSLSTAVTTMI